VLFADIKGSTKLLENLDPQEGQKLIDPVLRIMMDAVHRYEGTVNQVLGDGIMALFGAPLAHEDHALRACYAALAMQDEMRRYRQKLSQSEEAGLQIGVGMNSDATSGWGDTAGQVTDEASYASAIEKVFGSSARDRILAIYPVRSYPTPRAAFVQATTDAQFTCQSRRVAQSLAQVQREPVYRYIFPHTLENDPALKSRGAAHSIEQSFLFPQRKYEALDADRRVQRQIVDYWSRIARIGNPNGGGEPEWPVVTPDNDVYLEISAKTEAKNGSAKAHCDFWDTIRFPWPHL
jgi:para-nitrobenzyl esterase